MKNLAVLASTIAVIGVAIAYAQNQPIYPSGRDDYYVGGYLGGYHSSTAAEGRLRGMGDLARSQGQANLDNSAAAINYTQARSNQIDNQNKWTSTYFDMRETNRRARAAERGPRPSMEALVRYAQAGKPKPLSPSELDAVSGAIHWPMFLQSDDHAANRAKLERIFVERAKSGAIGREDYMKVREVTDTMLAELKKQVREIPPAQYMTAKRFLQSLAYEAAQPVV